ncbi:hypothetical protein MMC30_004583 [Trapelia coarctata]|nr:hypothetical protein [Trapelia coarctata]
MANEATPRVNAPYLESFTNQTVRIVGKVTALHGETATLDAAGEVQIILNRESHLTVSNAAEIIGKVQPDLSVKVLQAMDFGSNFGEDNSSLPLFTPIAVSLPFNLPPPYGSLQTFGAPTDSPAARSP